MSPKTENTDNLALQRIAPLIHEIRGERVILDSDLARIYGVATKRLNEQVKRNANRFPEDFAFQLTSEEWSGIGGDRSQFATTNLKSQIATSSLQHGGRRKLPYAFTEHGAIMAANVLNSKQAVEMSVFGLSAQRDREIAAGERSEPAGKMIEKEIWERAEHATDSVASFAGSRSNETNTIPSLG